MYLWHRGHAEMTRKFPQICHFMRKQPANPWNKLNVRLSLTPSILPEWGTAILTRRAELVNHTSLKPGWRAVDLFTAHLNRWLNITRTIGSSRPIVATVLAVVQQRMWFSIDNPKLARRFSSEPFCVFRFTVKLTGNKLSRDIPFNNLNNFIKIAEFLYH